MHRSFRLAVIGTGTIAATGHLPAAIRSDMVEVTAVVDTVRERALRSAQQAGISPLVTTRLSEVLGAVDGAVIATPNDTHHELIMECLDAGVPVLVEKPLATTAQEGEAIVQVANARGIPVAVGYCFRFDSRVRLMRQLVHAKYFGAPRRFAFQWGSTFGYAPLSAYSLNRRAAGGGVLIVNGIHLIDRMIDWFGSPAGFQYRDDSFGGPEATSEAEFHYGCDTSALHGIMRLSKTVTLPSGFVLETDRGIAVLPDSHQQPMTFRPHDFPCVETLLPEQVGSEAGKSVFQLQIENFVHACRNGHAPAVPAEEGLQSLRLVEALYARRLPLDLSEGIQRRNFT